MRCLLERPAPQAAQGRASNRLTANCTPEDTAAPASLQRLRENFIARRGVPQTIARAVAEIAFVTKESAR